MEPGKPVSIRRCAIYTRKSSEEGLEQNFNSLHAQREACEAFIRSQAGEGSTSRRRPFVFGTKTPIYPAGSGYSFAFIESRKACAIAVQFVLVWVR
jgi:hypothetical protein